MTRHATQNRQSATARTWFFRIAGFFLFVLVIGFGWHYAWQHGARLLDEEVTRVISRSNDAGREIDCAGRRIEGYPFRIGIFCDRVSAYGVRDGISISTGALRTAAQFYQPGKIIAELDGPLVATTISGAEHTATWESLRSSARVGLSGLNRISVQTRKLDYSARAADPAASFTATFDNAELHLRPTPAEDEDGAVDLAFLFGISEITPVAGPAIPAFALSGDVRLDGMREELRPGFHLLNHLREKGLRGKIRRAQFAPLDGGDLAVSGSFDIARNGRLSATLDFESTDATGMVAFLARAFPERDEMWDQIGQAVTLLAGGSNVKKITLEIDRGAVFLGLFHIADIPPLF